MRWRSALRRQMPTPEAGEAAATTSAARFMWWAELNCVRLHRVDGEGRAPGALRCGNGSPVPDLAMAARPENLKSTTSRVVRCNSSSSCEYSGRLPWGPGSGAGRRARQAWAWRWGGSLYRHEMRFSMSAHSCRHLPGDCSNKGSFRRGAPAQPGPAHAPRTSMGQ